MRRDEALALVRSYARQESNVKHMLAVGAIMRRVAHRLGENEEEWEVAGILHDIDFEICCGPHEHGILARNILEGKVIKDIVEAIAAHNHEYTNVQVDNNLKKALIASDAASGLIIACALVTPSKRLADLRIESVIKKFHSKDFAKRVDRGRISLCEEIGLRRDEFLTISLEALKSMSSELGL